MEFALLHLQHDDIGKGSPSKTYQDFTFGMKNLQNGCYPTNDLVQFKP